jgi:hypothetical protein
MTVSWSPSSRSRQARGPDTADAPGPDERRERLPVHPAHIRDRVDLSERMAKGVRELDVFETAAEEESILNHRLMLMIGTGIDSGNYLAMLPSDEWTKDARR